MSWFKANPNAVIRLLAASFAASLGLLPGVEGSGGAAGAAGVAGSAGVAGVAGPVGSMLGGAAGVAGPAGTAGVVGSAGVAGVAGPAGAAGVQGQSNVAVQIAGSRVGPGSTANYMSGSTGSGRDFTPGTCIVLGVFAPTDVVNNQHLIGYNVSNTAGWQLTRSNGRVVNLIWGATFVGVLTLYKDWNVIVIYRKLDGTIRVSCNGEVARTIANPSGGYTNAGASGVFSILKNASANNQPATENSIGYYGIIDAAGVDIADATLQAWSGQANALDAWHAHSGVSGNANKVDFHNADDWDGSSATWTGTGSAPVVLNKQGTLTKFVLPSFDWRDVPETAVSDSSGILGTQGASGESGIRRSSLDQITFTTNSLDTNSVGGLRIESLSSNWLQGQSQIGLAVNGVPLAGNNVGFEPIPGGTPTSGYGLRRRLGAAIGGAGSKNITLIEGGQPLLGSAPQSQGTLMRVGVIAGSSFTWGTKAVANDVAILLYDSRGTQTEGVSDVPGVKGPCYDSFPIWLRANVPSKRFACEGYGSGTLFARCFDTTTLNNTLAIFSGLATGLVTNTFVLDIGVNDHILAPGWANSAAITTRTVLLLNGILALGKPGTRIRVCAPNTYINAANTIGGLTLADIANALAAAVTAVGNANVTFHDLTNTVDLANRTDASKLHYTQPGHVQRGTAIAAVL